MRLKKTLVSLVLCLSMTMGIAACTWSNVVKDIQAILVGLGPAAINTLTLISTMNSKPVNPATVQTINTDMADLSQLLNDYNTAETTAKAGWLAKLDAASQTTVNDLKTIFAVVGVGNTADQNKADALITFVMSEAQSLATLVTEIAPPPAQAAAARAQTAGVTRTVTKHQYDFKRKPPLSASQFRAGFNAKMKVMTGNGNADAMSASLVIK